MVREENEFKKLYRSKEDRYVAGLAGGFGDYFNMDANIWRIIFIVLTFTGGVGLILYLIGLVIVPENPSQESKPSRVREKDSTFILAIILIIIGLFLLTREFGLFDYFHFWKIPWSVIWAVFLIVIGVLLILSSNKSPAGENKKTKNLGINIPDINKLYRSRDNRMIAGICGGIGEYFNIDPSLVRLVWILASFASVGLGILVYVILIFVLREKPEEAQ
jgi:phage shock protein C